jgi:UDP-N-acetyl-D-glucosamine dehydrogenase
VIVTDHSAFDWAWIAQRARLIVDTRNALKGVSGSTARIVKL